MKKVLFIDRDGTIIREPDDFQVDSLEKLRFVPGAISSLAKIARETDFELVMVTNQDGLGTDSFPEKDFHPSQNLMLQTLADEGVEFVDIYVDPTMPHENAPTRKPGTGMLGKYLTGPYDLANSYVIGDRMTDVQLAQNLGSNAILIINSSSPTEIDEPDTFVVKEWPGAGRPCRCRKLSRSYFCTQARVRVAWSIFRL